MRLGTVLKIVAAALVLVAVALIAASKALDSRRYQGFLIDQVRAASGLELSFSGPTKIKLGLSPQVSFTGLTLAARPNGPAILYIDRIEARVALLPLVFRTLQLERVSLYRPVLRLGALPKPTGGMDLARGGDKVPVTRLALAEILVEDAVILWRDGAAASDSSLHVGKARIQPESVSGGPLNLQLEGRRNGSDFQLAGVVGSPAALIAGKPYPVQLKGTISGAVVVARGHLAEPLQGSGLDLDIRAQGDELADLVKRLGIGFADRLPAAIGPYKASARLSDGGLREIDAVFGKRDNLLVTLKGAIKTWAGLGGVDLALSAEAEHLSGLSRLIGVDLPDGGPLKLSGRLNEIEGGWRLTGIKSSLGKSDFSGELAFVQAPRPRFFGRLSAGVFAPTDLSFPQGRGADPSRPSPQRPAIPVHDGRILSLDPLPLEWLKAFDLNISLAAARLHLAQAVFSDAAAEISLANGRIALDSVQAQMGPGLLKGAFRLDLSGRMPAMALKLAGSGLELDRLGGDAWVAGGRGDLALDLKASGISLRALAGSLDGTVAASLSESALAKGSTELGGDVIAALDAAASAEERSRLRCATLRLAVKGGLVSAERGIVAETGRITVAGSGTADLRTETLDLAFAAKGTPGIRLRGMLGAPVLTHDGPPLRLSSEAASCRPGAKARR